MVESGKLLVCSDCGQEFPASEMRRCKTCGHYVCSKCRGTHVANYHKTVPTDAEPVVNNTSSQGTVSSSTTMNEIHAQPVVSTGATSVLESTPKKKHTGLIVFLVIIGILALIAVIVAILMSTGFLGFDSSTMWDSTHFLGFFITI